MGTCFGVSAYRVEKPLTNDHSNIWKVNRTSVPCGHIFFFRYPSSNDRVAVVKSVEPTRLYEIRTLKCLQPNPRVVRMYSSRGTDMLTEYCSHGDLFDFVARRTVSHREIRVIIGQVVRALLDCHALGFAHMDLKLENVGVRQLEPLQLCLLDFGAARKIDGSDLRSNGIQMSLSYAPPELIGLYYPRIPHAVDAWTVGVMLYALLCQRFPFSGNTPEQMQKRVCERILQWPDSVPPSELRDIATGLLVKNPRLRTTLEDIRHLPWIE